MLGVLILIGAFFRLFDLGLASLRGDSIIFWGIALSKVSPGVVLSQWKEVSGGSSQMPLAAFVMQAFVHGLSLPVTLTTVRLPFALMGVLSIPIAFFAARRFAGLSAAVLFTALLALNPYHIQYSREVYSYSSTILGYLFYFWAVSVISPTIHGKSVVPARQLMILAGGLFLSAFSQMTGLIICAIGVPYWGWLLWLNREPRDIFRKNVIRLAVVHAVVLSPHLFVSWGPRTMLAEKASGASAQYAQVAALYGETMPKLLGKMAAQYGWGWSPAGLFLLAVSVLGLIVAFFNMPRDRFYVLGYFIVAPILLYSVARSVFGSSYESRYVASVFPFYLMALTLGLLALAQAIVRFFHGRWPGRLVASSLPLAACGMLVYPAYLSTQLTGAPAPYRLIVDWLDSHLPQGTPVLVDRWFEPWNELRWSPSTNVFFTFTIPNEPVDVYLKYQWRETAKAFFAKYRDAAYMELAKSYWEVPEIGFWKWPREYFARHVAITNEAGMKLRLLGLAARGDYYSADTNRVVVDIFYNTREDVLAKAQSGGEQILALYGTGWGYAKPWQQTGDYRDWRVVQGHAALDVYNLTAAPVTAQVRITGVAVGGTKRVRTGQQVFDFQGNQVMDWTLAPMTLQPGLNHIEMTDGMGNLGKPLLVGDVVVTQSETRPAASSVP